MLTMTERLFLVLLNGKRKKYVLLKVFFIYFEGAEGQRERGRENPEQAPCPVWA